MVHIRLYYRAGAKLILLLASSVMSTHHYDNYLAPAASNAPPRTLSLDRGQRRLGDLSLYRRNTCIRRVAPLRLRDQPNSIMSIFFLVITAIVVAIVGTEGAAAQLITPAPIPPTQYLQKRAFDSSWATAHQKCWSTGAPCQYPDFIHACQAEWKDLDYLWCLCTTEYYEALHTFAIPSPS